MYGKSWIYHDFYSNTEMLNCVTTLKRAMFAWKIICLDLS